MHIPQVVDEIRSFLQSADQVLTDHLKSHLTPAYHAACQEANQRLRRCDEYLTKGLRSEAIHLAQAEPVLLDLVAMLDFPERKQYEELCLTYGLPAPPQLQMDTATALNEAYADDQPIEELMRKHRMLALGRGPLGPRLALQRRIAQLDARNPVWEEDIRTFERARFQQMFEHVDSLIQRSNLPALASASNELAQTKWLVPPPAALVNKINGAVRRLGQAKSLSTLQTLEVKLYEAMNAFDMPQATALRRQWDALVKGAGLAPNDPLAQRVAVVFQWMDEQLRRSADEASFQSAAADLQDAIDAGEPATTLEGLAHKLLNFNRGMPELLQQRYQARLRELTKQTRRRKRNMILIPAACVLFAAGVTGWIVYRKIESESVSKAAESLNRMVEADRFTEAKAFLGHLSQSEPNVRQHRDIVELQARIEAREKEEHDRKLLFQEALKDAEAAKLDSTGEALVAKARALARLPEEQAAVQGVARTRREKMDKLQVARDNAVVPRLREAREAVAQLEKMLRTGADTGKAADLLGENEVTILRLQKEARDVSEPLSKDIESLVGRLETARKTLEGKNLEGTLVAAMTQALKNPDDLGPYAKTAERYIKEFPDRELSKGLRTAIGEQDQWQSVAEWGTVVKSAGLKPLTITIKDAKTRSEACRAFMAKHPKFPDTPLLDVYLKCLEAIAQRDEADAKSAVTEFRGIFGDQLVKDLWFVKLEGGKVYYAREDIGQKIKAATDGYLRFYYLVGYNTKDKNALKKLGDVTKRGQAPQSIIAESARALPESFAEKSWEETVVGFAQKVRDNKDMDPILQVILLRRLLACAVKGSYPLQGALADFRERIDNRGFEIDVAWIDPENKEAAEIRRKAGEFMGKFPSLAPALKAATENRQKLEVDIARTFRVPVGLLTRSAEGRWECRTPSGTDLTALSDLYVLVPAAEGPSSWLRVGRMEKGKPILDAAKGEGLVEGRLIFAARAPK